MSFDKNKIAELYPESEDLMWEPQLCWKLPKGKENMLEEVCGNGDYFASLKKDGACYQVVKTPNHCYLFGRTISKTTGLLTEKIANTPHIEKAFSSLPANTVIVVEIYYPGKTSKDVTSIMGCLPREAIKRQENNPIHAYAHDILMYNGVDLRNTGALERYKILEAIWKLHSFSSFEFLELAQPIYENIFEEASLALKRGEEGLVLRKKTAGWSCGKRPAWTTLKLKQTDSIDLVCIGLCPPTKEYSGKELESWEYWDIGSPTFYDCYEEEHCFNGWRWSKQKGQFYNDYMIQQIKHGKDINFDSFCRVDDNERVYCPLTKPYFYGWPSAIEIGAYDNEGNLKLLGTVSSGLSDEDKQGMGERPDDYIGKVVSLDCMSIDKTEHTLRHPVFKSWRDDKNAKDCLISEVFK